MSGPPALLTTPFTKNDKLVRLLSELKTVSDMATASSQSAASGSFNQSANQLEECARALRRAAFALRGAAHESRKRG